MKLRKLGQVLLATAVSLGSSLAITSCGNVYTIDFLYVTSSKNNPGQVAVYKVDNQSGALTPLPQSPYPSGGRNPVAEVTSPDSKNLYVVNRDDNTVVQFAIGSDGKLYPLHTVNTPGGFPVAVAVNPAGTFLYVVDTYQPGFTDATPGPGALVVFPLAKDGSLGAPVNNGNLTYFPVGFSPMGVTALANGNSVYVATKHGTVATDTGRIYMFSTGSGGSVAPLGSGFVPAGVAPNAIASDPTGRFVYATDGVSNQLIGYTVTSGGILNPMINGPFKTDQFPNSITIDPRGYYIYVTNFNSNTLSAYALDQSNGTPAQVAGSGTFGTRTGPTCVVVEPGLGRYVYTSNFLDNTVTAFQLNPHTGSLVGVQNSPFAAPGQPTCVAAIAHGNHAVQAIP
ncbi:MAG TPA: beta-propeller fold lactonase family protein [Acidisarcina sp.]|nr:beta-propeller fold lactonase family protein [Acidisarcina sp.]